MNGSCSLSVLTASVQCLGILVARETSPKSSLTFSQSTNIRQLYPLWGRNIKEVVGRGEGDWIDVYGLCH